MFSGGLLQNRREDKEDVRKPGYMCYNTLVIVLFVCDFFLCFSSFEIYAKMTLNMCFEKNISNLQLLLWMATRPQSLSHVTRVRTLRARTRTTDAAGTVRPRPLTPPLRAARRHTCKNV